MLWQWVFIFARTSWNTSVRPSIRPINQNFIFSFSFTFPLEAAFSLFEVQNYSHIMRDVIQVTKRSCEIPMFRPCPHTPTKTLWIYEAFRGCIEELSCSGKPVDGTFLTKEDCVKSCVTLHWHVKSDSVLQSLQRSDWAIQTNLQPNHQKGFPQNLNLTGWQNYWHQEMCQVQDVAHNILVVRCDSISNIHPPRWVRLSDDSICEKQLHFFLLFLSEWLIYIIHYTNWHDFSAEVEYLIRWIFLLHRSYSQLDRVDHQLWRIEGRNSRCSVVYLANHWCL